MIVQTDSIVVAMFQLHPWPFTLCAFALCAVFAFVVWVLN